MAIPAGLEAPVPRMLAASAAAVPTGFWALLLDAGEVGCCAAGCGAVSG